MNFTLKSIDLISIKYFIYANAHTDVDGESIKEGRGH